MASLLNTVRDLDRLRQIVTVLVRHGFGGIVERVGLASLLAAGTATSQQAQRTTPGERLRLVMQDLGPSFVKLGQILSTRPDLLPEDIVTELKKLQDEVAPVSFEQTRTMVETELGAPLAELFATFEEKPLASASISQVHRAQLRLEDLLVDVVVKVQRPKIKDTIERDVDLLYWLARAIERSIPEAKIYSPVKAVAEFDRSITAELDFNLEADNAVRFARNFDGVTMARFPEVYRLASSRRVLTLEFLPGLKVYDAVRAGYSAERIAKSSLAIIIKQVFEDGFFHADPHPGNFLILGEKNDPIIGLIDLGLVGRLTPQLRDRTIDLMVAAVREDRRGIADALYAIGRPTKRVDRQAYEAEVAVLSDRYLGKQLKDIQLSAMIRDLVGGAVKYGIEIPPDFLMVGKALMTIEGIGKEIYPQLDVFEEVKPYFLQLVWQRYSPEKISTELVRTATRLGTAAADLPLQAQEVMDDLRKGRLTIRVREPQLTLVADSIGRRIFSGLVTAAFIVAGGILIAQNAWLTGILMLFFAGTWILWHTVLLWITRRRNKEK